MADPELKQLESEALVLARAIHRRDRLGITGALHVLSKRMWDYGVLSESGQIALFVLINEVHELLDETD